MTIQSLLISFLSIPMIFYLFSTKLPSGLRCYYDTLLQNCVCFGLGFVFVMGFNWDGVEGNV